MDTDMVMAIDENGFMSSTRMALSLSWFVEASRLALHGAFPACIRRGSVIGAGFRHMIVFLVLIPGHANAGNWELTPRLNVSETYSDNIALESSNSKESDFVTSIAPGIRLTGAGGRMAVSLDYSLRQQMYRRKSSANGDSHQLSGTLDSELYEQMVFLDSKVSFSQQNISNQQSLSSDNINTTGNRQDVMAFSVRPIFKHHFGAYADAEVSNNFSYIETDVGTANSKANNLIARLTSGSRFALAPWSLEYRREEIDHESGVNNKFTSATANVQYVFDRKYSGSFTYGVDDNSFATSGTENDGTRWNISGIWTPSSRTRLEIGYGDRYSGSSYNFSLIHTSRRTLWAASYSETTTSTRTLLAERVFVTYGELLSSLGSDVQDLIDSGQVTRDAAAEVVESYDLPVQSTEVLVNKAFNGSMSWRGRRSNLRVGVFRSELIPQISMTGQKIVGLNMSADRKVRKDTTVGAGTSWSKTKFSSDGRTDESWNVLFNMDHAISRSLSANLVVSRNLRSSTAGGDGYNENRANASLNVLF